MEDLLREWDGAFVVARHDRPTGTGVYVAVHTAAPEAAAGGTRIRAYPSPRDAVLDALRLAEGMSLKFALLDLPRGGGKAVLDTPPGLVAPDREGLLDRFGDLLQSLGGVFQTGPDMGTTARDMDRIAARTRFVFGTSPARGGAGDPGPTTALGVLEAIRACVRHRTGGGGLDGQKVLVQGLGDVGLPLARLLAAEGARVIGSDVRREVRALAGEAGWSWAAPEEALSTPCDVLAPCAVGGILDEASIPRLRCSIVAGSANNQLRSADDADRLRRRGILYAPDFAINGGGALFLLGRERLGWDQAEVDARTRALGPRLEEILRRSEEAGITTTAAAMAVARQRLGVEVRLGRV